jgi:hypothetical protein
MGIGRQGLEEVKMAKMGYDTMANIGTKFAICKKIR